jgi:hypothetical protein
MSYDNWLEQPYQDACEEAEAQEALEEEAENHAAEWLRDPKLAQSVIAEQFDLNAEEDLALLASLIAATQQAAETTAPDVEMVENQLIALAHQLRNLLFCRRADAWVQQELAKRAEKDRALADEYARERWERKQEDLE